MITSDAEEAGMGYLSQLSDGSFREQLENSRDRDMAAQYSLTGIHKDDIDFLIGSWPIKRFGSQGQQKSFVVAMKLAQFEYTRKIKGFKPLLLLDDIFDKLDDRRVSQLIRMVNEDSFGQVFITDTQEENIRRIFEPMEIEHKIINLPL
jgi:DNA replication and repair protein RecF